MKLVQRQSLLASLLIKQNGYRTVKHYAKQLNISERTVHSDLKIVGEYLVQEGYVLDKKPGIGIGVKKLHQVRKKEESTKESNIYSTIGRRKKIIEWMLFEQQTVTFEKLSEAFLISRSSIKNDLKFIQKLLTAGNQLQMISDSKGTRFNGSERDMQKAYLEFNRFILEEDRGILESDEDQKLEILSHYYGKDIVSVCSRVLYDYIRNDVNLIAEYYIFNVLNMMIILVYRILKGAHLEELEEGFDPAPYEHEAAWMLDKISLRLNFTFTANDVLYLSTYLISNKFEALPKSNNDDEIVTLMIAKISESLKLDLTNDQKLREQLLLHVPPMIYRLQEGILTNNPFIYQIKKEFSVVFNLIWMVLSKQEDELKVVFNEDEIGFLTIHFQSAIERTKVSKKVLIVCPTGIATSELLLNRIINILPAFTIIEVASIKELSDCELGQVDLIISTVPLEVASAKTIVVSPLLSNQDIKNISDFYNEAFVLSKDHVNQNQSFEHLKSYLSDQYLFLNQNFKTKEELLTEIGNKLVQQGVIAPPFIESAINREELGGTDMPTGAAIPHGNPKYAQETAVVMITNQKAIKWNEYYVKVVLLVCLSDKETRNIKGILSDIYSLVQSKEMIDQLHLISDKKALKQWIGR